MTATTQNTARVLPTDDIRIDGREKVTGQMMYTADMHRPDQLWAAFTVSPFPHAKIVRIDTSKARAVAGVKAVLTGEDIGPVLMGRMLFDWPVLAYGVVRFIGDRVAAVAAETREAAERAAALVDVTYEEMPAILDPLQALAPDAPILHPDRYSYFHNWHAWSPDTDPPRVAHPNMQGEAHVTKGAPVEPLFASAHRVFRHTFTTPRLHAGHIEPHATMVWIDGNGVAHIYSCNKSPFLLRNQMSRAIGIPPEQIIIYPTAIGGDFGGKGTTVEEYACYYLAKATGRPVRYTEEYSEELKSGGYRHPAHITLESALDADGKFIAHRSTIVYDGGAYAASKPTPYLLPGANGYFYLPYNIPNSQLDMSCNYTNAAPASHVRAPVSIKLFFAFEQHVDLMAEAMGIDGIAFRRRNTGHGNDTLPDGHPIYDWNGDDVLDALEAHIDVHDALPRGRGRGVAFAMARTGGGFTNLKMTLTADGKVDVETGVPEVGVGMHTAMQRVAAEALGIAVDDVTVRRLPTNLAGLDPGVGGAWGMHTNGRATVDAANKLRDAVAERTGTTWRDGAFVDAAGRRQSLTELAARACAAGPLAADGSYKKLYTDPNPFDYMFIALCIDVVVDLETGAYKIVDVVQVVDIGTIINPIAHQGQMDGGFIYGLGSAGYEELLTDESGKVININLGEYKLPTIADIPPLRTVLVQTIGKDGAYGAKAAGEVTNVAVPAALANAIAKATGVRLYHFPITSERIYNALSAGAPLLQ
jgi:CO/xanthine dehydrogenase Mo-binding subunit